MAQTQLAELIYAQNIDNSAGAQFDQTLVIIDITVPTEPKATMADGSTSSLSDFFAKQLKLAFQKTAYNFPNDVFKALLSIQTVTNVATPALTVTGGPAIFQCAVTIPAGYVGSFLWGMTPSIAGGWALPGGAGAGGGGGAPSGPAGGVLGYVEIDGTSNPSTYPNPNGLAPVVEDTPGVYRIPVRNDTGTVTEIRIGPDSNDPLSGGATDWTFYAPAGADAPDDTTDAWNGINANLRAGDGGNSAPGNPTATAIGGTGGSIDLAAGDGGVGGGGGGVAGGGGAVSLTSGNGGNAGDAPTGGVPGNGGLYSLIAGNGGQGSATVPAGNGADLLISAGNAGQDNGGGEGTPGSTVLAGGVRSDLGAGGNNGRVRIDSVPAYLSVVVTITAADQPIGFVNGPVIELDADNPYVLAPAGGGPLLEDASFNGETVTLINTGLNDLTVQGEAVAAGSNVLVGNAGSRLLTASGGNITLRWNDTLGSWVEIAYTQAVV